MKKHEENTKGVIKMENDEKLYRPQTFRKGNKAASVQKGRKKKKTIIREKIERILNWDKAEKIIEKNIMEMLTSKNEKERMAATKAFVKFFKPKMRAKAHGLKGNIVLEIHGVQKLPEN